MYVIALLVKLKTLLIAWYALTVERNYTRIKDIVKLVLIKKKNKMIGIICKIENDAKKCLPMLTEDDLMVTFKNIEDARYFAERHLLCAAFPVIYIDLISFQIIDKTT